jgi:predicted Zn-dependent peptidase
VNEVSKNVMLAGTNKEMMRQPAIIDELIKDEKREIIEKWVKRKENRRNRKDLDNFKDFFKNENYYFRNALSNILQETGKT